MFKILHHRSKCIACGACAVLCADFFEMSGEDGLSDLNGAKYSQDKAEGELKVKTPGCLQEAANACPVQAIEVVNYEELKPK